jgi:hypothetical protein
MISAQHLRVGWKLPARCVGYDAQPARVLGAMEWIYRQLP